MSGEDRRSAWDREQTGSREGSREGVREPHVVELAREAMSWGMDMGRVIERLRTRIKRDEQYLAYRERKGLHTPTDDAIASDLRVLALAICYLEQHR